MSYGLAYILPFASIKDKRYKIEIEKDGFSGTPITLTGSSSPFVVNISDEDCKYNPTRLSTACISIYGGDYLQNLFSTDYRMHRVTLLCNNIPAWCGYLVPEIYSQDYSTVDSVLEIRCQSAISVLSYIDYKQKDESKRRFISLWEIIQLCVRESRARYNAIYVPHIYASSLSSFGSWGNVLDELIVAEQNFFDEEDKPMKLLDILEECMKILNWVCCDWQGSLYFIDPDSSEEYYKYNHDMSSYSKVTAVEQCLQVIGSAGNDDTLDIIPGYNKATVRCSNYPVGKLVPEEDYDKLKIIKRPTDLSKQIDKKTIAINHSLVLQGKEYITLQYDNACQKIEHPTGDDYDSLGATLVKRCMYEQKKEGGNWKDSINSYSYENLVRIRTKTADGMHTLPSNITNNTPILKFRTSTSEVIYAKGALALDFSGQICINSDMGVYSDHLPEAANMEVPVLVRLGDKYWQNWTNTWANDPAFILVEFVGKDMQNGGFAQIEDTKTLDMPYDNLRGIIMQIPEDMKGDIELSIYKPEAMHFGFDFDYYGFYLKDVSLKYEREQRGDVYEDNADRIYENVVNENYINEMDEIKLKISSYNNDGACYSKLSFFSGGYLEDNLYCSIVNNFIRLEELLIRRIVSYYSSPKLKIQKVINLVNIEPYTILSNTLLPEKEFLFMGGTINYKLEELKGIFIEK